MFEHLPPELRPLVEQILVALVGLLGAALTAFVGYAAQWVKAQAKAVQADIPAVQLSALKDFLTFAVKEGEQLGISGQLVNEGKLLKARAIDKAQTWLDGLGWKIDVSTIESVLESLIIDGVQKGDKPYLYIQGEPLKGIATPLADPVRQTG